MRVTHITAEASPFAKVGGLGDVCGALPAEQRKRGVTARVVLPAYRHLLGLPFEALEPVRVAEWTFHVRALRDTHVYLLECASLFDRADIYVDERGEGFADNALRFSAFALAGAELAKRLGTDVVHLHDWQSAIAAALPMPTLLTLHNIAYQGDASAEVFERLGISGAPFFGKLLRGGISLATRVSTVSPTHAQEMLTSEGSFGLLNELQRAQPAGILNGLDVDEWDPATQKSLYFPFTAAGLGGKRANKHAFLNELGFSPRRWHLPLLVVLSRIVSQKGIALLADALPALLAKRSFNIVLMGKGEHALVERLVALQRAFPLSVRLLQVFDQPTAHRLMAAGDFCLVPSLFEPCGLTQMQAQRYGTLPIVRRTGGLADTVLDSSSPYATGFVFGPATPSALSEALLRALNVYTLEPQQLNDMRRRAMHGDFSWNARAREYDALYSEVCTAQPKAPQQLFAVAPQPTRAYYHFRAEDAGTLALFDETAGREVARAPAVAPGGDGWFAVMPGHTYKLTRHGQQAHESTRFIAPLPPVTVAPGS